MADHIMIFNIQKFSLQDGPGIRTVVFFKGCPLRCAWCSNPESQNGGIELAYERQKCVGCASCELACPMQCITGALNRNVAIDAALCTLCRRCENACPQGAIKAEGALASISEIMETAMQDVAFYKKSGGGVTLSGGEVLSQLKGALSLIEELKRAGVHTAAETSGYAPLGDFKQLADNLDLTLIDLKHYDSQRHALGTGVDNAQIIENIGYLAASGRPFRVRIPVVPGFNSSQSDALGFSRALKGLNIDEVDLLPFHQFGANKYDFLGMDYKYKNTPQLHDEDIAGFAGVFENSGITVNIGG